MITGFRHRLRKAGCCLLVIVSLIVIRNRPQLIQTLFRFAATPSYPVVTIVAVLCGARRILRHVLTMNLRSVTSRLHPIIDGALRRGRRLLLLPLPRYRSLWRMSTDIVFYFSIEQCLNSNFVSYVWIFSLLGNGIIVDCVLLYRDERRLFRVIPVTAVTAILVVFILIKAGLLYLTLTVCFYVASQEIAVNSFILKLKSFDCDCFEGLEKFYVRLLRSMIVFMMGIGCIVVLIIQSSLPNPLTSYAPATLIAFTICYPAFTEAKRVSKILLFYLKQLNYFAKASFDELYKLNDVCAVCLSRMNSARVTGCKHYFHGKCLVRCIKTNPTCPMCKTYLTFLPQRPSPGHSSRPSPSPF